MRDRITTIKIQNNTSYKLICILMCEISIWSSYQSARFLAPMCFVCKRHLSTEAINQSDSKLSTMAKNKELFKDVQGYNCRPTQSWNGLQDHRQADWWEGDNSLCDYSQMEETQNKCQSPSVWGSLQDLTSYSFNDHENGKESAQNYTGGSCQWSQGSWDHSHQENNW